MGKNRKTTNVDLVEVLEKLNTAGKYDKIIERAKNNGYHDFKFMDNENHPEYGECICPKMQLVENLNSFPELAEIWKDVIDGMYDEPLDEDDKESMRDMLKKGGLGDSWLSKELGL